MQDKITRCDRDARPDAIHDPRPGEPAEPALEAPRPRPVVRSAFGRIAGYGITGRGYAIFRGDERLTPICGTPAIAWAAYRSAGGAR